MKMRLETLLQNLPSESHRDAEIADMLFEATVAFLDQHPAEWRDHYRQHLLSDRDPREQEDPRHSRARLERYAWRLAHAAGLEVARSASWPPTLGPDGRLGVRESTLLWCRFTSGDKEELTTLDLRPLRRLVDGSREPLLRALWRWATRSAIDRLDESHRDAIENVDQAFGILRLAIEEARALDHQKRRPQSVLDTFSILIFDPIFHVRETSKALELTALVTLYRAELAHLEKRPADTEHCLRFWFAITRADIAESWPSRREQEVLYRKTWIVAALARGLATTDAVDQLERLLSESPRVSRQLRAEALAFAAEPLVKQMKFSAAADRLEEAIDGLCEERPVAASPRVTLVLESGTARWLGFVHDLHEAGFFTVDPEEDSIERVVAEHRQSLRTLRRYLDGAASAVFGLTRSRAHWMLRRAYAQSFVLDDPHQAITLLLDTLTGWLGEEAECPLFDLTVDLLVPLRRLGWSIDEILESETMRPLVKESLGYREPIAEILAGKVHPLFSYPELRRFGVTRSETSTGIVN